MKRLLTGLVLVSGLSLAGSLPVGAGGWAVTTLDPLAVAPVAGEDVNVGFTIRQHGVTPVVVEDVSIVVSDSSGATESFAAVPQGAVGHYVATVTFPAGGPVRWRVEQGWFGPQDLGVIEVTPATPPSGTTAVPESQPWPALWRFALPAVAVGLLLLLALERGRRRSGYVNA
jgi:hypothetical protein